MAAGAQVRVAGSQTAFMWVAVEPGQTLERGLVALEAQAGVSAEGSAWSDYFYVDAPPHQAMTLQVDLRRHGTPAGWVDVYVRFGEWPTTQLFDASMTTNPQTTSVAPQFVLQAERLLNERIYVMVLAQGGSAVEYRISVDARANVPLLLVGGAIFALGVAVVVLLVRRWLRRSEYKDIP